MLVATHFTLHDLLLNCGDFLRVGRRSVFEDLVHGDLVLHVQNVERALQKVVDSVVVARKQLVLQLLVLANIWLEADILEPVSRAQFQLQLAEGKKLDGFYFA